MIKAESDGDEISIGRSVVALAVCRCTSSDHARLGSEPDAVSPPACDGDEVGIRRSVVAPTMTHTTPSDHGAISSENGRE